MTIDKRALREVAERATKGEWSVQFGDEIYSTDGVENQQIAMVFSINDESDAEFIAAANPATMLALLDENIQLQREKDAMEAVALALRDDMRQARKQLADAGRLIAELDQRLIEYAGIATREAHRVAELERANAAQDDHINQQQDRIDALEKRNAELGKYAGEMERYCIAYMEWSSKTEWMQTDKRFDVVRPLGKHRADVLREYIELISKNGNSGE